jgi:tRNA(Ile)-lysidine synthase TilS/MesJ
MTIEDDQWIESYKTILDGLAQKRVILFYSGGKDSSLCMELMLHASKEFDFSFEAHAGAFPKHRYSLEERNRLDRFWTDRGISIHWHEFVEHDAVLEEAQNPCLLCQKIRKRLLYQIVQDRIEDMEKLVLVPAFSLWDLVSYSLEHILSDQFSQPEKPGFDQGLQRYHETAQRFYPHMKMHEGYEVFRPLIRFNRPDIVETLVERNIPTLSIPCNFSSFRPKRLLQNYYRQMGLTFSYDSLLAFAHKSLDLPSLSRYVSMDKGEYLRKVF